MSKNRRIVTSYPSDDGDYIYRKSFRHWKTGRIIIAPPGRAFRFPRKK